VEPPAPEVVGFPPPVVPVVVTDVVEPVVADAIEPVVTDVVELPADPVDPPLPEVPFGSSNGMRPPHAASATANHATCSIFMGALAIRSRTGARRMPNSTRPRAAKKPSFV